MLLTVQFVFISRIMHKLITIWLQYIALGRSLQVPHSGIHIIITNEISILIAF